MRTRRGGWLGLAAWFALGLPAGAAPFEDLTFREVLVGERWSEVCARVQGQAPGEVVRYRFADGELNSERAKNPRVRHYHLSMYPRSFPVARRMAEQLLGPLGPQVVRREPRRESRGYTYQHLTPGGRVTLFLERAPGMVQSMDVRVGAR